MNIEKTCVFVTTDPLSRVITLKANTWTEHVLQGHGESTSEEIKNNVECPYMILNNVKPEYDGSDKFIIDHTRQDYIGMTVKDDRLYVMKTIVELENNSTGTIVTNHILRRVNEIKTIGGVIYDSRKGKGTTGMSNI